MNRKQKIAAGVWAALMAAAFGWFWVKLGDGRGRLEDVEADLQRCGQLRLGMDETEAVQLMGSLSARAPSPGGDTLLRFSATDPGVVLGARLDGRTGRLVEADCGANYHLRADQAYLRTLTPTQPGVGSDAARP